MSLFTFLQQNGVNLYALKTIPPQAFWLILSFCVLIILHLMYRCYQNIKRARVLEDMPTAKIRSAAQGYVELSGKQEIVEKHTSFTLLSHIPCTWYRYTIEFYDKQQGWRHIEHGSSLHLFAMNDGTGLCIIDPKGAEIYTSCVDHWQGFHRNPKKKPTSWLGRLWGTFGHYRYTEWTMHEGMPIHALGNFHTYDGHVFKQLYPEYSAQIADGSTLHVLSKSGLDKHNPFVLSSLDQKANIRQYRIKAFFDFIAFMILLMGIGWFIVVWVY